MIASLVAAYLATAAAAPEAAAPIWHERPAKGGARLPAIPSLAPLVHQVRDSVVHIEVPEKHAVGSGFVLDARGWILTNSHVLENASAAKVRLADGSSVSAAVVGRDELTDIALLKLDAAASVPLAPVFLGDSDALQVGDWVVAIGNPFGLSQSVSHGIVSAKERSLGLAPFDDFLQTDVSMNPGNSGGPLFNVQGEVVGITTARVSEGQGVGFAVPVNLVKELLPQLQTSGKVRRGWLGINVEDVAGGTVVKDIVADGPGAMAGLLPGDRLTFIMGKPVMGYLRLLRRVAMLPPGTKLTLKLVRGTETKEVTVTLADRPPTSSSTR